MIIGRVRYTNAEADARIAIHTLIAAAHHAKTVIGDLSPIAETDLNLDQGTQALFNKIAADILTHKNLAAAHHAKTVIGDLSPISLADLDALVCSEAEADGKITTHAGAADPHGDRAYADGIVRTIVTGSYVGNNAEPQRQITVGFKCSKVIVIAASGTLIAATAIPSRTKTETTTSHSTVDGSLHCQLHASDGFYVSGDDNHYFNNTGVTYYYWAISE